MGIECDFSEALRSLERMQKRVSNKVIDEALEEGAEPILQAQVLNVPVGDTGNLQRSLGKGKKTGSGSNRKIDIGIQNAQKNEVVYGYYQEHGTNRMAGKKWMKKSWQQSKQEANNRIKKSIVKGLKQK
nr:MAG: minor capsid protein [Bacteriophage sp.]